jgi:hypothetical protein
MEWDQQKICLDLFKNKPKDQMQNVQEQRPEYTTIWKWMLENNPNNGQTVRHILNQISQKYQKNILAKHN